MDNNQMEINKKGCGDNGWKNRKTCGIAKSDWSRN